MYRRQEAEWWRTFSNVERGTESDGARVRPRISRGSRECRNESTVIVQNVLYKYLPKDFGGKIIVDARIIVDRLVGLGGERYQAQRLTRTVSPQKLLQSRNPQVGERRHIQCNQCHLRFR